MKDYTDCIDTCEVKRDLLKRGQQRTSNENDMEEKFFSSANEIPRELAKFVMRHSR